MTESIGRNDPCPCGSGKKYKHCCLPKAAGRRSVYHPIHQRKHWNQAEQLHYIEEMMEVVSACDAMREEIDAAAAILEHHRAAFETLEIDTQALIEHSRRLFADARFIPFRYTADEVQQAFAEVGHPNTSVLNFDQSTDRLIAALRYVLVHRQDQPIVAHKLLMMLPEYVAEQRYMDAWIILHSARVMMDTPCQNNPFVFEMFFYGNDALDERIATQQELLLQNLGVDRETIHAMSTDEIEALVETHTSDPVKNAALETYLNAHPELQAYAESETSDVERQAVMLLDREDADCLYLDPNEVAPYLSILMERLQPLEAQRQEVMEKDEASQSAYIKAVDQMVLEVARGMVLEIFTPERIVRLRTEFEKYQRHLYQAGEKQTAVLARTASRMLQSVACPGENRLLLSTCYVSLHEMLLRTWAEAWGLSEQDWKTEEE